MLGLTEKELEEYSHSLEDMLVEEENVLPLVSYSERGDWKVLNVLNYLG